MTVHLKFSTGSACKSSYTGTNHYDALTIISRHIEGKVQVGKSECKVGHLEGIQEEKE